MLIQIARAVTLGIFDTEVQSLKIGEIYRVAPGIGTVLVSEGWAREIETGSTTVPCIIAQLCDVEGDSCR